MSDEKDDKEPQTGRTAWDFAAEVSQKLGLSIVILIGIAFGLYQFQDQALKLKEAERESNKDLQEKLNSAQQQLVDSAVAVGQLNKDMIENIQSGLGELQKLQSSIKLYQGQTEAEARKAMDAIAKQKEAEEATIRAKNDLKKLKLENETQQKLRIAKSGPFRDKVRDLVSLISDESADDSTIKNLAKEIRGDYLVDPQVLFQAVAKNINAENLEKLSDLESVKYDAIKNILKDKTNFAAWMLVQKEGKIDCAFGVVSGEEKRFFGFVVIEFDDKERIWYINGYEYGFLLVFPDILNWDNYISVAFFANSSELENMVDREIDKVPPGWPQGRMKFSDMISGMYNDPEYDVNDLAKENLSIMPITFDELQSLLPNVYNLLLGEDDLYVQELRMMEHKSKTFSAASIVPISLDRGHGDLGNLRSTILEILDAAVKKDNEKRQKHAKKSFRNWGLLASVVLNEQFVMNKLEVSLDRLEVSITCSFLDYETKNILTAKMNFRREQTFRENPWRIAGFVKIPAEPRQSVLQQSLR